jgi:acetyl-CoA decarbonylase/synthase complex subunit gamma
LLPWLPGRPLSLKGLWLGLGLLCALAGGVWGLLARFDSWFGMVSWCLLVPAVSSFIAMIYTGSTTYTSLSGVRYEMRRAVPAQVAAAVAGLAAWIVGRFI